MGSSQRRNNLEDGLRSVEGNPNSDVQVMPIVPGNPRNRKCYVQVSLEDGLRSVEGNPNSDVQVMPIVPGNPRNRKCYVRVRQFRRLELRPTARPGIGGGRGAACCGPTSRRRAGGVRQFRRLELRPTARPGIGGGRGAACCGPTSRRPEHQRTLLVHLTDCSAPSRIVGRPARFRSSDTGCR